MASQKMVSEMIDFCDKHNIKSFYLLMKYARKNKENWFRALCNNKCTYIICEYLKSKEEKYNFKKSL